MVMFLVTVLSVGCFIYAVLKVKCLRKHDSETVILKFFVCLLISKADASCQVDITERCFSGCQDFLSPGLQMR